MSMDMEALEQGDRSGEHSQAYRSEQVAEREEQGDSLLA